MKLKLDKKTADHLRAIISYGLNNYNHGNILYKAMLCEQLMPLSDKLHNPWGRKTKTLNISITEAACLWNIYHVSEDAPQIEPSRIVAYEGAIKPLVKQFQESR